MKFAAKYARFLLLVCSVVVARADRVKLTTPTSHQLAFQDLELGVFIHYSIDTYAPTRAAPGSTPASAFTPTELDAEQWVLAAKAMGATFVVLTARHEQGFCLWPTATTDYSVKSSPYKNGKGDIVREFVDACRKYGLKVGLYTPPWIDSHWELSQTDLSGGSETGRIDKLDNPKAYERALAKEKEQLRELMTNYGPLVFIWDDHFGRSDSIDAVAHGGKFREFYSTLAKWSHSLQPDCFYFGPDVEHVGNEDAHCCYPMWNAINTIDGTDMTIGTTFKWERDNVGDPSGKFFRPRLGCTTVGFSTGGWMWDGARRPRSLDRRVQIYYETIGRGANVLVNLTPDRRGLIPEDLAVAAKEMGSEIKHRFSIPLAQTSGAGPVHVLKLGHPQMFDHVITMEDMRDGQKISKYVVEALVNGKWQTLLEGQTVGHKRIDRFAPVTATEVRFTCTESVSQPIALRSIAIYSVGHKTL